MELKVINAQGQVSGSLNASDALFAREYNEALVHQLVTAFLANARIGSRSQLTRAEVKHSTKKPWRQKGTGRARQGSTRAPQWRGGGVVFGPTPRSYKFKLNRKVRRLALKSALSSKVQDNEFTAIDGISFEAPKTKQMVKVLENLNAPVKTLIVVDEITLNVEKSASNIPGVKLLDAKHVNVYDILNSDKLIMTEAAIKAVEEVLA